MFKKVFATLCVLAMLFSFGCTAEPTETEKPTEKPTQSGTEAPTTGQASKEMKLVDNGHCTVTVKGYDEKDLFGYSVKVFLENKTDKELMFSVDNVSVNGYMCDPFWATTVAAGKKANEQITFFESDLEDNGIEKVEEITFTLKVYDSNDITADYFVKETFSINP